MKHFKKFFSYLVALTMVLSLAAFTGVKVHAVEPSQTDLSITINAKEAGHKYEAYQIFKGEVDKNDGGDKKLSNIDWGAGIDTSKKVNWGTEEKPDEKTPDEKTLVEKLKTLDSFKKLPENTSANDVANVLPTIKDDASKLNEFAKVVAKYTTKAQGTATTSVGNIDKKTYDYTIDGLNAGYYLVQDQAGSITGNDKGVTDKAYTAYILNVVGNVDVTAKSDVTTVDKFVEQFKDNDNKTGDPETKFQKNADHEIGKTFKFKLAATVPADVHVSSYDSYKLKFNDRMSTGITFDRIVSVVLSDGTNNGTVEVNKDGYTIEGLTNDKGENALTNGGSWSLTIPDIKKFTKLNLSNAITATVIYDAHLNENAKVNVQTPDDTTNKNTVDLQYSNNPNAESLGKTEEHTVYVFTYGINNKKTKDTVKGDPLDGAEFKVYRGNVKSNENVLKFVKDSEGHYVLSSSSDSDASPTVTSNEKTGRFDLYGLDEGTYTIEETKSPAGYSKVDPFTITITATLGKTVDGKVVDDNQTSFTEKKDNEELTADSSTKEYLNTIADKSGSTLPSTGGMGTTLLYVAGGILVACAAAYVVMSRKHSTNK